MVICAVRNSELKVMVILIFQVYCDYHGHSRRKNIFIYGCSAAMSWIVNDARNPGSTGNRLEDNGFKVGLSNIMRNFVLCLQPGYIVS